MVGAGVDTIPGLQACIILVGVGDMDITLLIGVVVTIVAIMVAIVIPEAFTAIITEVGQVPITSVRVPDVDTMHELLQVAHHTIMVHGLLQIKI